jgi:adenosylmethionine-8-amino-7-oxononanoate aminotransferase
MGNPLAAAVSLASIRLLLSQPWAENVRRIERGLVDGLAPARAVAQVRDVRVLGGIGVIETREPLPMAAMQAVCLEHGVWLRPFGRLVYTMPPYVSTDGDIGEICAAMVATVERVAAT